MVDQDFDINNFRTVEEMRPNVLRAVRDLEVPRDELIVVGGAALQIFGIKVSPDIDVVVTPERMEYVLTHPAGEYGKERVPSRRGLQITAIGEHEGQVVFDDGYGVQVGQVTYMLAPNDSKYSATFEELHEEAVDIEGILVSPPSRILAWKEGVNRAKDARDIKLINKYLTSHLATN